MGAQRYDEAISQYSAALSLDPSILYVYIKRNKVYMAKGSWKDALDDVNWVRRWHLEEVRSYRHIMVS